MMRAFLLCALVLSGAAWAAELNGYVESRTQFTRARVGGLFPTDRLPQFSELLELNAFAKHAYAERGFFQGDLSIFYQWTGNYRALNAQGQEVILPARDREETRPRVSVNELYWNQEVRPELALLLGKKRIVWGSGFAFNPTDLLNPRKDPTDPTFQKAGAVVALAEVPLERFTVSLLASPEVLAEVSGIPYQVLSYPSWNQVDDELHYLVAARAYALVAESDLNLILYFTNRYRDEQENKLRLGASFSRYFFTDWELHLEAIAQTGSPRSFVTSECVESQQAAARCIFQGTPLIEPTLLDSNRVFPKVLVGMRRQFADESMFSLEYLFQNDGYTRAQFQDFVSALDLLQQAAALGLPQAQAALSSFGLVPQEGVPQKFVFEAITRHYLFATYQKPKIRDDWTVAATLISSLTDLSGLISPSVAWSATEWLTLTASVFVPFPGPNSLAATVPSTGERVSEYTLLPMRFRGLLSARVYY